MPGRIFTDTPLQIGMPSEFMDKSDLRSEISYLSQQGLQLPPTAARPSVCSARRSSRIDSLRRRKPPDLVSTKRVKPTHIRNAFAKPGINSRTELTRFVRGTD
jgi:hypothetical protein